MQKILLFTVLGVVSAVQAITLENVGQIMEGLMVGALKAEGFGDIVSCFTDVESFGEDVVDAVKDFEEENFDGVKNGIEEIGKAITMVSSAMTDCKNIEGDWQKIKSMAEIFASPYSLAWHIGEDLLVNGIDIYDDISDAVTDFKSAQYEQFGEKVGDALAKTLLGSVVYPVSVMPADDHVTYEIMAGYALHATNHQANTMDLYNNIHNLGVDFIAAFETLANGNTQLVKTRSQAANVLNTLGALLEQTIEKMEGTDLKTNFAEVLKADSDCLKVIKPEALTKDDVGHVQDIMLDYLIENYHHVGKHLGLIAATCKQSQVIFISL